MSPAFITLKFVLILLSVAHSLDEFYPRSFDLEELEDMVDDYKNIQMAQEEMPNGKKAYEVYYEDLEKVKKIVDENKKKLEKLKAAKERKRNKATMHRPQKTFGVNAFGNIMCNNKDSICIEDQKEYIQRRNKRANMAIENVKLRSEKTLEFLQDDDKTNINISNNEDYLPQNSFKENKDSKVTNDKHDTSYYDPNKSSRNAYSLKKSKADFEEEAIVETEMENDEIYLDEPSNEYYDEDIEEDPDTSYRRVKNPVDVAPAFEKYLKYIKSNNYNYETLPEEISVHAVKKGINSPRLMVYALEDPEQRYPPWMFKGFYSPKEWHRIPPYYFSKHGTRNRIRFVVESEKIYGKSFMEFSESPVSTCINPEPSPRNIITSLAKESLTNEEFSTVNFDKRYPFSMYIPEDGTDMLFVKLTTPSGDLGLKPSIDKGSVSAYHLSLDRISIHFGEEPGEGSEHQIDGKSYGMEMQFIFTKQTRKYQKPYFQVLFDYYETLYSKVGTGKDVLILSFFFEVAEEGEPVKLSELSSGIASLALVARNFWRANNREKFRAYEIREDVLSIDELIGEAMQGIYYTYDGSLNHPPCFLKVRWSVFERPIRIPYSIWENFAFIPSEFSDTTFMGGNFRSLESIYVNSTAKDTGESIVVPYLQKVEFYARQITRSKTFAATHKFLQYDYYEYEESCAEKISIFSILLVFVFGIASGKI